METFIPLRELRTSLSNVSVSRNPHRALKGSKHKCFKEMFQGNANFGYIGPIHLQAVKLAETDNIDPRPIFQASISASGRHYRLYRPADGKPLRVNSSASQNFWLGQNI